MTRPASVTPPLFENSAKELLVRLEGDTSEEAEELRTEARALIVTFREWMVQRPTDPVRTETVTRLFALYRRALNYLLSKQ